MPLNAKQLRFIGHYLKTSNATLSARLARYSAKTARQAGARMLTNDNVKRAIAAHLKKMDVSVERVVNELARVAFSSITDVVEDSGSGLKVKPLEELSPDVKAAVSEISEQDTQYGKNRKVKMHGKIEALKLLGQHLGMFNDKTPASALPPVTDKDETERT